MTYVSSLKSTDLDHLFHMQIPVRRRHLHFKLESPGFSYTVRFEKHFWKVELLKKSIPSEHFGILKNTAIYPSSNSLESKKIVIYKSQLYYLEANNLNESIKKGGGYINNQNQLYLQLSQCTNQDKFIHIQNYCRLLLKKSQIPY